jgi:enoyl-CoA hydratase/carnithine racemase
MTIASALTKPAQIRIARRSPAYWRVTIDNPPINVMGPEMVREFQGVIDALESTSMSGLWSSTARSRTTS